MSREKNLAKNTIVLAIGRFLPKAVSVITLPILTGYLSKAELGIYDMVSTLVMLLLPIASLQIQSAAFRFLIDCRGDKEKSREIISNIFGYTVVSTIIVSCISFMLISGNSPNVNALICLYFFLDSMFNGISQVTRGLGYNKVFSIGSIILSVINGSCIVLFVAGENLGLIGVMLSLIVANIISITYFGLSIKLFDYISIHDISINTLKRLLSYSWPMVPNSLSNWILKLSDRAVILAFIGIEANATYAVANKIPNLLSIAQSVLVMAWQENASLAVNDKDASSYYTKMFEQIFALMIGFTGLLIGFTPYIFTLLIRGDYDDAYYQMPILIFGMFFYCMSAFQGGIYVAHKRTKNVGISTFIAAIINLVIDLCFVRTIGITAGSVSTLVAFFVLYIYRMVDTKRFQPMDYHIRKQILNICIIIVMLIICFFRIGWLNLVNSVAGVLFCFLINKNYIRKIVTKV